MSLPLFDYKHFNIAFENVNTEDIMRNLITLVMKVHLPHRFQASSLHRDNDSV